MADRHGGDASVLGRLNERAVNVLGAIQGRAFFPTHGNGLKAIAGRLGFRWAAADPSGLQAIVWRHKWEVTRNVAFSQTLLDYNRDDCAALRRVVEFLRGLGNLSAESLERWHLACTEPDKAGWRRLSRRSKRQDLYLP